MPYYSSILANGLRIVHLPSDSNISYCGFAVNAGARDERPEQHGLAHFVEHVLFKGTKKRKAWHILNRMENVGGELNAYTSKEETLLYAVCLSEDTERAIELLADLIFNSQFPEPELEKEREIIIDEINSYLDTPSELIFDDFENLLFDGNELGHHILGDAKSLRNLGRETCLSFVSQLYRPDNMVFFFYGNLPPQKILRLANKYMSIEKQSATGIHREIPLFPPAKQIKINKNLYQTHVVAGGKTYPVFDEKQTGLHLLNNLLGGPGMNSRLNVSLREKRALVYSVESGLTSYTDAGFFTIYFGCDSESESRCLNLIRKELKRLRDNKLSTSQFAAAIKQWKGQLGIMCDQKENLALGFGKSCLRFDKYESLPEIYRKIDTLTAGQLLEIANEIYDENQLFMLIYQ